MAMLELRRVGCFPADWLWLADSIDDDGDAVLAGNIPAGVVLDHGDHKALIAWVPVMIGGLPAVAHTLESLVPLTIKGLLPCPTCGVTGRIEQGHWVPVEGGHGG